MTSLENTFIDIIRKSVNDEKPEKFFLSPDEIEGIFYLSFKHNLLPMVYDYLSKTKSLLILDKETREKWQKQAIGLVIRQITQTNEFLNLIADCQEKGYDPVVVKGIICRILYPVPLTRASVDEDIFVRKEEIEFFHQFLLSEGLSADKDYENISNEYELSYHKENSPTYIEMHSLLFDPEAEGYNGLNQFFMDEVFVRTEKVLIDDVYIRTLSCTDHLLFLIFHAYKHFIYSGVGIRPICDIGMFANHYAEKIDWKYIRECLEKVNVFYYARALFNIVKIYLLPDSEMFEYIRAWNISAINVESLMDDVLASGALGDSSEERLHTSNMTLHAVEGHKGNYVLNSLFPAVRKIKGRYPYLNKYPFLLPVAWIQRIFGYLKDSAGKKNTNAASSVKLGMERIELLRKYRIIN